MSPIDEIAGLMKCPKCGRVIWGRARLFHIKGFCFKCQKWFKKRRSMEVFWLPAYFIIALVMWFLSLRKSF